MKISAVALKVLSEGTVSANTFKIATQLDRNEYNEINKVLLAAGAKWNRKLGVHLFETDAEDRVEDMILTENVLCVQKDLNFFPTPDTLITSMINAVEINENTSLLEPSFGDGRILKKAIEFKPKSLTGIEINKDFVEKTKEKIKDANLICDDFLNHTSKYDVILMNPPFKKKQGVRHTTHALNLLNAGGKLVSILPSSILYNEDKESQAFREKLKQHYAEIINLDEGLFKESGTMVKTVMVIAKAA